MFSMAKMGRPAKFNEKIRDVILRLLKEGKTEAQIAEVIGVCPRTLQNWQGKHPDLLHAVRESKQSADELLEASLYRRAAGYSHPAVKIMVSKELGVIREEFIQHYPPDTQALMFWLRNRQPKKWREKTEGDVTVHNNLNVEKLSDEELDDKIESLLAKMKKAKNGKG